MAILKVINGNYIEDNSYINLINYIFKENNIYKNYYGCQYLYNNGIDGIAQQFKNIAGYYHQTDGILLYHYIVSFSNIYEGWINTPEIALKIIGQAMCNLPYAAIWCVHGDTDDLHVHIIMSPVDFTRGLKYPNKKENHEALAERITFFELIERKNIGKIYKETYGFFDDKQEEIYTTIPSCIVVYE